jgi:hypothetical protein
VSNHAYEQSLIFDSHMKAIQRFVAPITLAAAIPAITFSGLSLLPSAGTAGQDSRPATRFTEAPARTAPAPIIQLALLLDTSNSMDGLIDQAKGQLWKIVNEFISAKQNGQRPTLEVALFEYGKSTLPSKTGFIRLIQPLTNDLDKISEELFALRTNGGEEFCGWVIQEAVGNLAWSTAPDAFKAIFIAGNEPFTQGPVSYVASCQAALAKGIIVNTIHCGSQSEGIATKWQDGAFLAEGKYMVIDQNREVVHFTAPQDKDITALGEELNKTYVPFGVAAEVNQRRQVQQDANSASLAAQGSPVQRSVFKSSPQYRNESWDLVDASRASNFKLSEVPAKDLPVPMQKMNAEERQTYLNAKATKREQLQKEIARLHAERVQYAAEQSKKTGATNTLDAVVISTIREQATKKNYRFE